jgi:glycine/D-amino acid oxidase-like deaminating enzyme
MPAPHAQKPRIVVFGAGAFGGWTALNLIRRGASVRIIDAWGPGNLRSSSGGETRVIRATYGTHAIYTAMAIRALHLWSEYDQQWRTDLFRKTGVLWLFGSDDRFGRASADTLRAHDIAFEPLSPADARRRYPQIDVSGVSSVFVEPDAGYLLARRACEHILQRVVREGGQYLQAAVAMPARFGESRGGRVALADGSSVEADGFVFTCGAWLGQLFPDVIGSLVTPTRQEVYHFGTPPGDTRFLDDQLPVWLDFGDRCIYGVPGAMGRAFKVADDTPGSVMDPTTGERTPTPAGLIAARVFLTQRFPDLASAPLVGSEVCQYESTPDANFIIDRHPSVPTAWIIGGGSGHGFKMGPVIGEIAASLVLGDSEPDPYFGLARFASPPSGGWQPKWS